MNDGNSNRPHSKRLLDETPNGMEHILTFEASMAPARQYARASTDKQEYCASKAMAQVQNASEFLAMSISRSVPHLEARHPSRQRSLLEEWLFLGCELGGGGGAGGGAYVSDTTRPSCFAATACTRCMTCRDVPTSPGTTRRAPTTQTGNNIGQCVYISKCHLFIHGSTHV